MSAGQAAPLCDHCGLPVPPRRQRSEPPWFCCLGCRVARQIALPALSDDAPSGGASTRLLRLGSGIFLTLNVMIASWLSYSTEILGVRPDPGGAEDGLLQLAAYAALFLCTLVIAILGLPLAADSLRALTSAGRVDAQLLIVLGVLAAYGVSAANTLRGAGPLYFDTAAVVLVVVTLGAHLEARSRQRSAAVATGRLVELPAEVSVWREDGWRSRPTDAIVRGDRVEILPGHRIPVDGTVLEGASRLDTSSFTGESRARTVEPGGAVLAGSFNHEGRLIVEATRGPEETVLATIERGLAEARSQRPPIQRLADRVAAVFVPGICLLAVAVFARLAVDGNVAGGALRSLSVLLIACPCALGLAAPLATWHGLRRAAERGVVVDSPATLERLASLRSVFFDKTGTLTHPEAVLERIEAADGVDEDWLMSAAVSLEAASPHPIARALERQASQRGVGAREVHDARTVPGRGVEARLDGRKLRLGSLRWVRELEVESGSAAPDDGTEAIYLMDEDQVLGWIAIGERTRPGARGALAALRNLGCAVRILSGDRTAPTERVAQDLGAPSHGELLPEDKVDRIVRERRSGPVAMVGDGLNDVPVLAAADVGIAMGSATDLAGRSGNVRLVSDRLGAIPELLALARDVRRSIRLNLAFAFGFNSVGVALAVAGLLTPVFAAVAMAASSLAVLKISSSAGRIEPERDAIDVASTIGSTAEATG